MGSGDKKCSVKYVQFPEGYKKLPSKREWDNNTIYLPHFLEIHAALQIPFKWKVIINLT